MGNSTEKQCKATLKNGQQCAHKARKNSDYCGTASHQAMEAKKRARKPSARTPARALPDELEYAELARRFFREMEACGADGVRVQWARMVLEAVRSLKAEELSAKNSGARPVQVFVGLKPPDTPRPD